MSLTQMTSLSGSMARRYIKNSTLLRCISHSLILNNKMQKLISQIPGLETCLSRIPQHRHQDTIKHLIRLGLEITLSQCCKEPQCQNNQSLILKQQLDRLRDGIQELNQIVRHQCQHHCLGGHQKCGRGIQDQFFQTQPGINDQNRQNKTPGKISKEDGKQTQKLQQQIPVKDVSSSWQKQNTVSLNPFIKRKPFVSRHHLDDSQARQALQFPQQSLFNHNQTRIKRKSHDYKKHVYQDQINKQDLTKIKEQRGQSTDRLDKLRRDRTVSDYSQATSKIKPLLDKDKIRFHHQKREVQFNQGYNQYEYSNESQMEESSQEEHQQPQRQTYPKFYQGNTYSQHYQSSFKASNQASSQQSRQNKTSSKKQFQRSKNSGNRQLQGSLGEQIRFEERSRKSSKIGSNQKYGIPQHQSESNRNIEYQDDVVSNSSSFSQFSINGSRRKEVGKISRRSNQE